jgi:hypothetical protein
VFGDGLGCISSLNVGPAGYLYVIKVLVSRCRPIWRGLSNYISIEVLVLLPILLID